MNTTSMSKIMSKCVWNFWRYVWTSWKLRDVVQKVYSVAYVVFSPTFGILTVCFKTRENRDYQTKWFNCYRPYSPKKYFSWFLKMRMCESLKMVATFVKFTWFFFFAIMRTRVFLKFMESTSKDKKDSSYTKIVF